VPFHAAERGRILLNDDCDTHRSGQDERRSQRNQLQESEVRRYDARPLLCISELVHYSALL
jgi:hypothetical protein